MLKSFHLTVEKPRETGNRNSAYKRANGCYCCDIYSQFNIPADRWRTYTSPDVASAVTGNVRYITLVTHAQLGPRFGSAKKSVDALIG